MSLFRQFESGDLESSWRHGLHCRVEPGKTLPQNWASLFRPLLAAQVLRLPPVVRGARLDAAHRPKFKLVARSREIVAEAGRTQDDGDFPRPSRPSFPVLNRCLQGLRSTVNIRLCTHLRTSAQTFYVLRYACKRDSGVSPTPRLVV
jgi:hypothetical protein